MAPNKIYDGYRVYFSRDEKHLFYALLLKDPDVEKKDTGLLYRVRQRQNQGLRLQITHVSD